MPIHKLKLIDSKEVARATYVFTFHKPEGFTFIPGQYGGFTLMQPIENEPGGHTRRFSLLSTPDDAFIAVATRMQNSAYKRNLKNLAPGDEVKFAGPTGNFILHTDVAVPAVFIAGGIGITPFYSMIRHATHHHSSQPLTLFYGNQKPEDAAFLDELDKLQKQNPFFKMIPAMADADQSWAGERGFISDSMLKKYIPDLSVPIYYVCGSPAMVNALHETLKELGINDDQIKIEDFPGY